MAKSKSGGTRTYLRGRVGADVYSVGRDAKGKRQQVVRSLAETVANPQTVSQMRGRMIMSTIMQALSALKPIVDHSFDNVSGVQPNLSEFIARNYALIKADVLANPASGNRFGLNAYMQKGAKQGCYVISDGQAGIPAIVTFMKSTGALNIDLTGETLTVGGLKSALGLGAEGYLTIVGITAAGIAEYARLHVNYSVADDTAISASNLTEVFQIEGNATPTLSLAGNVISATLSNIAGCSALIVTRKNANGFIHSKATLGDGQNFANTADVALPTYPVGANKFLNGGDESFSPAPVPEPTPTEGYALTQSIASGISSVQITANGVTVASGAEVAPGAAIAISGVVAESGYHMEARLNGNVVALTKNGTTYSGNVTMPAQASTLALTKVADDQPTPSADTISVNGTNKSIAGTGDVEEGSAIDVVVGLAEGSTRIGKLLAYGTNNVAVGDGQSMTQGNNSLNIPSSYATVGRQIQVMVGTSNSGEFQLEEVLYTINVTEGGDPN